MKAYFDGGNEADSTQYKTLTLVAFAATEQVWRAAEKAWNAAAKSHGANYLHRYEAISLTGQFEKEKGWGWNRVEPLLSDCIKVFRQFRDRPLYSTSCTILLKDHLRAIGTVPEIPRAEYICSGHCLVGVMAWYGSSILKLQNGSDFPRNCVDLFFDQGEPFRGHVVDQWNQKKIRSREIWWGVRKIAEANMRNAPGLQMADMLAWAYNRPYGAGGYEQLCHEILAARTDDHVELGYERLIRPHPERFEVFKELRLPKRRSSR